MRRAADLVDEHEFVLRPVQRTHPGIALVPEAQVQEVAIDAPADGADIINVTPVHADEVDRAISRYPGGSAQRLPEEPTKGLVRHLARGHGELAVAPPRVGVAADANIVGRVEDGGVDLSALPTTLCRNSRSRLSPQPIL